MSDSELLELTKARAVIVSWVMQALGSEFEQCGEELARRVMEHGEAFHEALRWDGKVAPEEHIAQVATAGRKAILGAVRSTLRLLEDSHRAGRC